VAVNAHSPPTDVRSRSVALVALVALVIAAAVAAAPALAQVPVRTLATPSAKLAEPFSVVSGVREISDGRLIVVDSREISITLVDFKSGGTRKLSRVGQGPGEFLVPQGIHALAADTTFVLDMMGRGMGVMIVRDSVVAELPKYPNWTRDDPAIAYGGDHVDQRGHVFSHIRPRLRESGFGPDSTPIERLDRATGRREIIARFDGRIRSPLDRPTPTTARQATQGTVAEARGRREIPPFFFTDEWVAAADGRVAIVTVEPYRVTYIAPTGRRTAGPVIEYDPVRVTDAEKEMWREGKRQPVPTITSDGRGGYRGGTSTRRVVEPEAWPEVLPAFLPDAARFATDGSLWIRRATAAAEPETHDVIDAAGRLTHRVRLPARAKLVGFGNGAVYIVRLDDDDLQYLERHPIPR
jgi:hypothetical protein